MESKNITTNKICRHILGFLTILPLALSTVSAQDGKVFWSDADGSDYKIFSTNIDGTDAQTIISGVSASKLTVDRLNQKLYYFDYLTNEIKYSDFDGSNPGITASLMNIEKLEIDSVNTKVLYLVNNSGSIIYRSNPDGTDLEELVVSINDISNFTIDPERNKIYYLEENTTGDFSVSRESNYNLKSANLSDNSNITTLLSDVEDEFDFITVSPDGGKLLWRENGITELDLTTNQISQVLENPEYPIVRFGIAPLSNQLILGGYISTTEVTSHFIQRIDFDGTNRSDILSPEDFLSSNLDSLTVYEPFLDTDEDGTPDIKDECQTDASKIAVGVCGCGIADVDTNTNGTIDCIEEISYPFEQLEKVIANLTNLKTSKAVKNLFGAKILIKEIEKLNYPEATALAKKIARLAKKVKQALIAKDRVEYRKMKKKVLKLTEELRSLILID